MTHPLPAPLDQLSEEAREILTQHMEPLSFEPETRILEAGAPGDGCYIIDEGEVRIQLDRTHPDTEHVLEVLQPGTILGELSLLDQRPRSASAVAETAVRAREITLEALERLNRDHPQIGLAVVGALGRGASLKLRKMNERLAEHMVADEPDPEAEEMVSRAVESQKAFEAWEDERVDALLQQIAEAVAAEADALARETVAETKMGNVDDKAFKNRVAALGVLQSIAGRPAFGELGEEADGLVTRIASPAGVVFGIIPVTNPVPTAVFKTLVSLKARNALILSFHRASLGVGNRVGEIIEGVLERNDAPPHLVQWIRSRGSRKKTRSFMSHPHVSLILATGGSSMVRAAYSSGTPAIGVGPGNAPAWVCEDADLAHAAGSIVASKSFDHGLICGAEHNLVVDAAVQEPFMEALEAAGAAVLDQAEARRFAAAVIDPEHNAFRMELTGQSAQLIADRVGVERDHPIHLIVAPVETFDPDSPFAGEKLTPILSLMTVDGEEEGFALARRILDVDGAGHTAIIHTRDADRARRFGHEMPASRILVNSPGSQGVCGVTTALQPSFTLGCGTFGGNSTTDNVSFMNLLNVKRLAQFREPAPEVAAMREPVAAT